MLPENLPSRSSSRDSKRHRQPDQGRLIERINSVESHSMHGQFRIGARGRSSADRYDAAVSLISKQQIEARASTRPVAPKIAAVRGISTIYWSSQIPVALARGFLVRPLREHPLSRLAIRIILLSRP